MFINELSSAESIVCGGLTNKASVSQLNPDSIHNIVKHIFVHSPFNFFADNSRYVAALLSIF